MHVFRFGRFLLDPQARELFDDGQRVVLPLSSVDCLIYLVRHRDRPVGRDELAAAVWERVDVSDVSVSHAIMRLRRLLGDTGNDQRIIRTVPRLGYRWVMEGTSEAEIAADPPNSIVATGELPPTAAVMVAASSPRGLSRNRLAAILVVVLASLVIGGIDHLRTATPPLTAPAMTAPVSALVLPAEISAPEQWAWMRLGLMDLIANQLRRGDLATAPSETVVALLDRHPGSRPLDALQTVKAELRIQPSATLVRGSWTVRLEVHREGDPLIVESHADDPVRATRAASDELLIKLGHAPPAEDASDASVIRETLRQRVNAAVLSGQLGVARQLVEEATPALQNQPEIALSQASVEFFSGNYEMAAERIESLLDRVPARRFPELRGRALSTLGATRFRQNRIEEASAAYGESIELLQGVNQPISLAKALVGRGGVASQRTQLDSAARDYGRARALYELGNDPFGVAIVDLNLGMNAIQRGQPAVALPILRSASERLRKLGAEDALAASLVSTVEVELLLLDVDAALATSDGFDQLERQAGNQRLRWDLLLSRARALAASGRLHEADAALERLIEQGDPVADAGIRLQAIAVRAANAFMQADFTQAAELAARALTPELVARAPEDAASVRLIRIRALLQNDASTAASAEIVILSASVTGEGPSAARIPASLAEGYRSLALAQPDQATDHFSTAMELAKRGGIPADLVAAGEPLIRVLIGERRIDEAAEVYRQLAPWADRDMRVAWCEGLVDTAQGRSDAAAVAFARARKLAAERVLPVATINP